VIDHVSIAVADLARAAAFYDAVLATVGLRRRKERAGSIGWGPDDVAPPVFWIHERRDARAARPGLGLHVSFHARSRDEVHAFRRDGARARRARRGRAGAASGVHGGLLRRLRARSRRHEDRGRRARGARAGVAL